MFWKRVRTDMSSEKLIAVAKKIRDGRFRMRVQAIALLVRGKRQKVVAEAVGTSVRSIRDWVDRYNAGGIDGLREKPRCGAPVKLKDTEVFRQRVLGGPAPERNGLITWSGWRLRLLLSKEFGVTYSLSGTYNLLHRLNLSSLKPRPRHPQANREEQEAFKKTLVYGLRRLPESIPV